MAGLELKGVGKSFGCVEVIHGIDLTIAHGEFVVFVGPSGCGKSTLLRMICGLEQITAAISGSAAARSPRPTRQARHRHGVPVLCALSAYDGRRRIWASGCRSNGPAEADVKERVDKAAAILHLE